MKVLTTTSIFPPDIGGPATYTKLLSEELPQRGVSVDVLSLGSLKALPVGIRQLVFFFKVLSHSKGVDVIYMQGPISVGLPSLIAGYLRKKKCVMKIVGDHAWERGVEKYGVIDSLDVFSAKKNGYGFVVGVLKKLQTFTASHVDEIVVPSQYLKTVVQNWGVNPNSISVVYNAFNTPDVELKEKDTVRKELGFTGPTLVSAGRLVPWKGFAELIDVFSRVIETYPDAQLYIVGSGDLNTMLKAKIREKGLENSVMLTGALPQKELFKYIYAADAFVLNTSYEGLSHQLLEAMYFKTPIVTTKVGGNPELIQHEQNGLLVQHGNLESLHHELDRVLGDQVYAETLASNAYTTLDAFTKEAMLTGITELLKKHSDTKTKRVLFIGMGRYDLSVHNATQEKKFTGLTEHMQVHVLARGPWCHTTKYKAHFHLMPQILGKVGMPLWLIAALFRGWYIVITQRIDTIVVQSPAVEGPVGAVLKVLTGRELVVEAHADWINSYFFYFNIPFEKQVKWILSTLGRFSLRRADKVRIISTYTRRMVESYVKNKPIYNFPTFTNIDMFKEETGMSWEKTIVYTGVLYRLKGVQFLIEAFNKLKDEFPEYKLVIIGDGPYRGELETFMNAGKDPRIEFTGRKELAEVKNIMKSCTVFVLPSLSEGLGRVLIEAGTLGKPLIGSNVDGIPDLIKDGENGYVFEPGNVQELEEKLRMVISDQKRAREMGARSRERMFDQFSTEKYFSAYRDMIYD